MAQLQADVVELAGAAEVVDLQAGVGGTLAADFVVDASQLLANDAAHQMVAVDVGHAPAFHKGAVAENAVVIGDLRQLAQAVRHIHDAGAARGDDEDEMAGFIIDNTISHVGHDFYYYFADRMRAISRMDFNLVVRERPDARWGSLVTVEFEREVVYRRFLPPNTTELKDEAVAAADLVKQQIIQRKLQRLLQDTTDLERDEL